MQLQLELKLIPQKSFSSLITSNIDTVNSGIAFCSCCCLVFLISHIAKALKIKALLPLKTYNWSLNESNVMHIHH
tara:strand:+ start:3011 stop:3235 length:225 start_codon:yes stop_codon:yes gene_type:complete